MTTWLTAPDTRIAYPVVVDVARLLPGGWVGGSENVTAGGEEYPEPPAVTATETTEPTVTAWNCAPEPDGVGILSPCAVI